MRSILSSARIVAISSCALPILLSGCAAAPRYAYDLKSESTDVVWRSGQSLSRCEDRGLRVEVGFLGVEEHTLRFQVRVENATQETVDLDPSRFRVFALSKDSLGASWSKELFQYAKGDILPRIDDELAKTQAEENPYRQGMLGATADLLVSVADLSSSFKSSTPQERAARDKNREDRERASENRERDEADWEAARDRKLALLHRERDFWSREALGRTTLTSGQSTSGVLVSSMMHEALGDEVEIRSGDRTCRFRFSQTARRVDR